MGQQRQLMDKTFRAQRGQGQQGQQGQGQFGQNQPGQGQSGQGQPGQGQPGQNQPGQGQQGQSGQGQAESGGNLAQDQQALHDRLNQIIQGLKEKGVGSPDGLNGAGQAMDDAQKNLSGQQFGSAAQDQQNVIDQLRKSAQQLAKNTARNGQNSGNPQDNTAQALDPLGRPIGANGTLLGGSLNVPDATDLQRAREILDELRKRAGELGRNQEELEYIDRLLKLF
jgi:hypothetical protein